MPHRYELLALLGAGGMGKVYRARHRGLDKLVALKLLDPRLAKDGEVMRNAERFDREARAIARLDHPGCVRIYDHAAGFFAMELLDGPTLAAVLDEQGQLPIARARAIADDLLGALAHAHAHGVLHRDLKPQNVMLVRRGAVIIDFGLAALHDAAKLTLDGMAFGTPSYLAPERLHGAPHDARADLYAVGVMLYEMIAGIKPFVGASPEEILRNARARPPRPLRVLRPDVPRARELGAAKHREVLLRDRRGRGRFDQRVARHGDRLIDRRAEVAHAAEQRDVWIRCDLDPALGAVVRQAIERVVRDLDVVVRAADLDPTLDLDPRDHVGAVVIQRAEVDQLAQIRRIGRPAHRAGRVLVERRELAPLLVGALLDAAELEVIAHLGGERRVAVGGIEPLAQRRHATLARRGGIELERAVVRPPLARQLALGPRARATAVDDRERDTARRIDADRLVLVLRIERALDE